MFGPVGCLLYLILQICSQKHHEKTYHIKHRPTFWLLILIYVFGIICGIFGFTMHSIRDSGDYCERYGIVSCFGFLGGGKDIMYLIFIQRAKIANGKDFMSRRQLFIYDVLFPIYVFIHWMVYIFGTALFFPAVSLTTFEDERGLTFCIFQRDFGKFLFLTVATAVDAINCLVFLYIFIMPVMRLIKETERTKVLQDQRVLDEKQQLLRVMKWNFVLAFVATLSSCLSLVFATYTQNAIWGSCLFDPLVNSSCTYFMMKTNRNYIRHLFCDCTCDCNCNCQCLRSQAAVEKAMDEAQRSHIALE